MDTHLSNGAKTHKSQQMSIKKTNAGAKAKNTTNPSKKSKLNAANLSKASKESLAKAGGKAVIYNYPKNCTTYEAKKAFRRKARLQRDKYTEQIQLLTESPDKKAKKELAEIKAAQTAWKEATYLESSN